MCCEDLIQALEAETKRECFSNSTVAFENGKRFAIDNRSAKIVCKVVIDDCFITSNTTRKCDYLFIICETQEKLLVELKGNDVIHAISQIIDTLTTLERQLRHGVRTYKGFIVSSSVPRSAEQKFRKAQEKSLRDHGLFIRKGHNQMIVTV